MKYIYHISAARELEKIEYFGQRCLVFIQNISRPIMYYITHQKGSEFRISAKYALHNVYVQFLPEFPNLLRVPIFLSLIQTEIKTNVEMLFEMRTWHATNFCKYTIYIQDIQHYSTLCKWALLDFDSSLPVPDFLPFHPKIRTNVKMFFKLRRFT